MASLSTISSSTTGVSGILMAVPQIAGILSNSAANTIGYQPTLQNGLAVNPPALIFHYEGEQTTHLESDITDHFVEDNTAIQDQIALRPEIITTHGFIGELTDSPPNPVLAALQVAANKLILVSAFTPELTVAAQLAYTEAVFAYNTALNLTNSAISAFSSIATGGGEAVVNNLQITNFTNPSSLASALGVHTQGKQQIYFQQFYGYWSTRTLFTVQTPWAVFQNMAIKSLRAIQDAETNTITDFEISFKTMRFAVVGSASGLASVTPASGTRLFAQSSAQVNYGSNNLSATTPQPGFA